MDADARKANFLVAKYNTGELYFRQLTPNIAIFLERVKGKYICYRLKWEHKAAAGIYKIQDDKLYCRGSWERCLNRAKSIVDFWEKKILKIEEEAK